MNKDVINFSFKACVYPTLQGGYHYLTTVMRS